MADYPVHCQCKALECCRLRAMLKMHLNHLRSEKSLLDRRASAMSPALSIERQAKPHPSLYSLYALADANSR